MWQIRLTGEFVQNEKKRVEDRFLGDNSVQGMDRKIILQKHCKNKGVQEGNNRAAEENFQEQVFK